ncbi:exo-alpha-sialidase [Brachybacterium sp.]|uniref:exo-alpha-sialidase n=1 Tax=Brachybacterium sp. TaxID=1891286 RepID=UPI003F8EEB99
MASVRTSIIGRPRRLSPHRRAHPATDRYTLICEEPDMDETTIVELSDGRVLLNSRDHARGGHRRIAISADGGQSWQDRGVDDQFTDPGNNAQLAGRFPDAPGGDPRARELLFTNAHDRFARIRGTLSISHDDGESWREALVFEPGPLDYSVVQALAGGALGILWEVEAREIRFARLEPEHLPGG